MSFQLKLTILGLRVKCLGVVTSYKLSSQGEPRIPAFILWTPGQEFFGMLIRIRLSHVSPLVAHLKWPPWMIKRGNAWRNARFNSSTDLLGVKPWSHREKLPLSHRCSDGWDAQKRTLTLEYLRNLPEYQPPRYHLAYVTASNYLWTLYIYIYIFHHESILV